MTTLPVSTPPTTAPRPAGPEASRWTTGRRFRVALGLLVAVRIVSLAAVLSSGQELNDSILGGDARRYGQMVTATGTPYADFAIEYPPLVLGSIKLIYSPDSAWATLVRLGVSQLVLDLATAAMLWWGWGRRVLLSYLLIGLTFLPFPLIYLRLDLLSVFLATVGWAMLRKGRDITGGAFLALSVFAKLWPLAVAPLLLVERKVKGLVAWALTGLAGLVAWAAWAGPDGIVQVASFRGATGWQAESLPGNVLQILDHTHTNFAQGAWRIGTMPGWSRPLFMVLSAGFSAVAWWSTRRHQGEPHPDDDAVRYGTAPLATVTAFLVFSSIISPQYTLWLLPYAAIACARDPKRFAPAVVAVMALSTLGLAVIKGQPDGNLWATLPVLARNLSLVWLLAITIAELRNHARGDRTGPELPVTADPTRATVRPDAAVTPEPQPA